MKKRFQAKDIQLFGNGTASVIPFGDEEAEFGVSALWVSWLLFHKVNLYSGEIYNYFFWLRNINTPESLNLLDDNLEYWLSQIPEKVFIAEIENGKCKNIIAE